MRAPSRPVTQLECEIGKRPQAYRLVPGPWDELLSELGGHGVRLGRIEQVGATMVEPLTIVSSASVARLAREAGLESLDSRRFRSLFELDGCGEHEEDEWQGRRLRAGEALIEVGEPVIRCAVTTRDPDTGERDLDTLALIAGVPRPGRGRRDLLRAVRARGRARARSCGRRGRGGLSGEAVAGVAPEASGEAPAHRRGGSRSSSASAGGSSKAGRPASMSRARSSSAAGSSSPARPRPAEARAASG